MPIEQRQIQERRDRLRSKPGMYLGVGGSAAIGQIVRYVCESVFESSSQIRPTKVEVIANSREITIHMPGWAHPKLSPALADEWLNLLWQGMAGLALFASDNYALESCDGTQLACLSLREDSLPVTERRASSQAPFLRFAFHPVESVFQSISVDGLYLIAGALRVLSLLQAGLATSLRSDLLAHEIAYYYQDGCKSLLIEEDYERWPLHPGCLSFAASNETMNVEGHLRFLHAGVPSVKTFVNYRPTQGGTDLEGLGDALRDVFPDCRAGCRVLRLVTNPDTGAKVLVPHSFIGVMHLRTARPYYAGPTRDVLCDTEAREFVHRASSATLKEQWAALRKQ